MYAGKQIVSLQATLGRLYSATSPPATQRDPSDRPPPFEHADYKGLENLAPADSDEHERSVNALLVRAAKRSEITKVMRWRPRDVSYIVIFPPQLAPRLPRS